MIDIKTDISTDLYKIIYYYLLLRYLLIDSKYRMYGEP